MFEVRWWFKEFLVECNFIVYVFFKEGGIYRFSMVYWIIGSDVLICVDLFILVKVFDGLWKLIGEDV